jgi:hypothetical protein
LDLIESIAESTPIIANRVEASLGICFARAVELEIIDVSLT